MENETKRCPVCGQSVPANANNCPVCGFPLK
ncbi:MAG: zinc-ribbon domain-containing protein [Paludibacteraceae bacterium]